LHYQNHFYKYQPLTAIVQSHLVTDYSETALTLDSINLGAF